MNSRRDPDGHTWLDSLPPFDLGAPNRPLLFDANFDPKLAYDGVARAIEARSVPEAGTVRLGLLAAVAVAAASRRN